ncbi:MAG TPA: ABC transporter permease [Candidatus Mediterraneibacter quadrami]|jgi:ABC-2 type transport system permease protein|uniref:ABC transporter permease n=1 Tax=Candidatus Mediterraneibacter quadrami TaxID=2838684 RepID=A0A9D2RBI0_9FIRM|nr:ABC transporter permease [Candidatus Mediterraneibacter quadrami]
MTAVFRHELRMMFSSLTAYVYGMFSLLAVAIYMMYYNLSVGYANFEYALAGASFALLIMIPIITMRIIAEEKKQKTDQLLYSLPISTTQVVVGKFLAVFVTSVIPLVIVSVYPVILKNYGNLYLPTAFGALFGYIMLTAALLSIGIFISSITESQPMAAGICFAAMVLNYYMVTLAEYALSSAYGSFVALLVIEVLLALLVRHMTGNDLLAEGLGGVAMVATVAAYIYNSDWFEGLFPAILEKLSVYERFYEFVDGVFDYTHVVYFISVIVFFLFLTVQSLEKRRYN